MSDTKSDVKSVKTVDRMLEALQQNNAAFKESKLFDVYAKLKKLGIVAKTEYSLPPKDTIGRTFHTQTQFKKDAEGS